MKCALILAVSLLMCQRETITQKQTVTTERSSGRIVTKKSSDFKRVDRAVMRPSIARPAIRTGGSWYWHPRYSSWFWFEDRVRVPFNAQFVLSPDFALPAEVITYELPAMVTVTCPHCGKTFQIPK